MRIMPTLISEGSADYYGLSLASDATRINEDWNTFFPRGLLVTMSVHTWQLQKV
jgi:hypothetical protein